MPKKNIFITDTEAVASAIREAEGRARVRTITPDTIAMICSDVEKHLGIAKTNLIGVAIDADPHAQHFANAYRGVPESTQFAATYTRNGWALTGVYRSSCGSGASRAIKIHLTDRARNAIVNRFEYMVW